MKAIEVRDISYRYEDGTIAVSRLSFDVDQGERIAILGPNGAGKSTLLQLLIGLRFPQQGTISIAGEDLNRKSADRVRRHVGMVFQDPDDQIFMPSVREDVAFGPTNMGLSKAEVEERVNRALGTTGLQGFIDRVPHHLSQGEKKRVAIAGVLAMNPQILLLDEPTSNLDGAAKKALIQDLKGLGQTICIATHDLATAMEIATRALVMDRSKLAEGTYREILSDPDLLARSRLEPPAIWELFRHLEQEGHALGRPTTTEEALQLLRQALHRG